MNHRFEEGVKERINELYDKFQEESNGVPSPIVARACLKMLAYMIVWENDGDENEMYGHGCYFGSALDEYQVEELDKYWKKKKEESK